MPLRLGNDDIKIQFSAYQDKGASRFNAAENKNNVSMMISPVCFSGYYIMSADHLETSYPHESAKDQNLSVLP